MRVIDGLISTIQGCDKKVSTPKEAIAIIGGALISIDAESLLDYRKRIDSTVVSRFHSIYRDFGVYLIEFPERVYVGSTGGGAMYFGRRWKNHLADGNRHTCLDGLFKSIKKRDIIFHAIALTPTDSISKFIEYGILSMLEKSCKSLIVNPIHASERKQRDRNFISDKIRNRAMELTSAASKINKEQPILFGI